MPQTIKSPFGTVVIDSDHSNLLQSVFGGQDDDKTHRHQNIDMTPSADIYEDSGSFTIWIDLPGVDKDSIDVSMSGQALIVNAQTKKLNLDGGYWVRHERRVGNFVRRLQLTHSVDTESITANYADGTLKISIAKPQREESTSIQVQMD